MAHESHQHAAGANPGYEVSDASVRGVVIFLVGLTLLVIVVQVILWGMLRGLESTNPEPPVRYGVQDQIPEQLRQLRKNEAEALAGSAAGAKMPIDAAIDRIAEQGLPPVSPGKTEVEINSHSGTPVKPEAARK